MGAGRAAGASWNQLAMYSSVTRRRRMIVSRLAHTRRQLFTMAGKAFREEVSRVKQQAMTTASRTVIQNQCRLYAKTTYPPPRPRLHTPPRPRCRRSAAGSPACLGARAAVRRSQGRGSALRVKCTVGAARTQLTDDVHGSGGARDDEQEDGHDENAHDAVTDRYPKQFKRVRARHARDGQARREGARSSGSCLVELSLRSF